MYRLTYIPYPDIARERTLTRMGSSGEGVQYICTAIIYKGDCFDFFWCRRHCASHWIQATLLPLFLLGGSMSMNVGRSSEGMHFFLLVGREWWSHHDVERKPHKLSEGRCVMLTTIQNHSFSGLARSSVVVVHVGDSKETVWWATAIAALQPHDNNILLMRCWFGSTPSSLLLLPNCQISKPRLFTDQTCQRRHHHHHRHLVKSLHLHHNRPRRPFRYLHPH